MRDKCVFAALEPGEELRSACAELQKQLRQRAKGSFPKPENLHVTVLYIGRVTDEQLAEITGILSRLAFPETELIFDRLERFPGTKGDQIVCRADAGPLLLSYQEQLKEHLTKAGIGFDRKALLPHVTLVRAKTRDIPIGDLAVKRIAVSPRNVILYDSMQIKGRRVYEPLWNSEEGR